MIDVHCHILPDADDGPESWEEAAAMGRMAAADGITHVVATPHANFEYAYDRRRHAGAVRQLQERLGGAPEIRLGCDMHFSAENFQAALNDPSAFAIAGTHYQLVELSDFSIPSTLLQNFRALMDAGLRLVLTHPERNPLLLRHPDQVLEWVREGLIVQVTANALTGYWGRTAQLAARWLLDHQAVHVVASDAHDTRHRPPLLSEARRVLRRWRNEDVARALVEDNPAAILRDEELPYRPE
jgi:protein-tyrosine phosphatase